MKYRSYDKDFKLNAIDLYKKSNKTMQQFCSELGIPTATLHGWIKTFDKYGATELSGSGNIKPSNEELYKMKKELAEVTMERDILKKALAIFSRQKI